MPRWILQAIAVVGILVAIIRWIWPERSLPEWVRMIGPDFLGMLISVLFFVGLLVGTVWMQREFRRMEDRFLELQGRIHTVLEEARKHYARRNDNRLARIEARLGMRPPTAGQEPPEGGSS